MAFVTLGDANYRHFPRLRGLIEKYAGRALNRLYERIGADPESRRLFPHEDQRKRAADAQLRHWRSLFSGQFDDAAYARSAHIGQVHANVGLSPC